MKKKPCNEEKLHPNNHTNDDFDEINHTDDDFRDMSRRPIDQGSDKAIGNLLTSAFTEEKEDIRLSGAFKDSLVYQMTQAAAKEQTLSTVESSNTTGSSKTVGSSKTAESRKEVLSRETLAVESDSLIGRTRSFLNREIEIPLVPLLAASVILIAVNVLPLKYEPRPEGRIINVGGAELWMPLNGEGEDGAYEN